MKLNLSERKALEELRREALEGQTPGAWWLRLSAVVAKILREDSHQYRSYRPWWWVQKQALIYLGYGTEFGFHIDRKLPGYRRWKP